MRVISGGSDPNREIKQNFPLSFVSIQKVYKEEVGDSVLLLCKVNNLGKHYFPRWFKWNVPISFNFQQKYSFILNRSSLCNLECSICRQVFPWSLHSSQAGFSSIENCQVVIIYLRHSPNPPPLEFPLESQIRNANTLRLNFILLQLTKEFLDFIFTWNIFLFSQDFLIFSIPRPFQKN